MQNHTYIDEREKLPLKGESRSGRQKLSRREHSQEEEVIQRITQVKHKQVTKGEENMLRALHHCLDNQKDLNYSE